MALNTFRCNHLTTLHFKGLIKKAAVNKRQSLCVCSVIAVRSRLHTFGVGKCEV